MNIIIGENNAGKSSLLRAMGLVFQRGGPRLGRYDFHQDVSNTEAPPSIAITVTLEASGEDSPEDKATVATWLTKLAPPWQATLTYRFFLPEEDLPLFKLKCPTGSTIERYWSTVEELLPRFVTRIYGGEPANRSRADPDTLSNFDYQFLDATRDVEERMTSGRSSILRAVVSHALDADLLNVSAEEKETVISERREKFRAKSISLMEEMKQRLNVERFLEMASLTGASGGGHPTIDGRFGEAELLSALRLMVSDGASNSKLPVTHNGLGYNNLLFMSLVLSHIEHEASKESLGANAKCFPMLVIEEPEAHLHPSLQYRLINYIKKRINLSAEGSKGSRQIFITTHSTHITAAAGLDAIICMTASDSASTVRVSYPGRVFDGSSEGRASKKYVERYLDATRSEMLFAKAVLFVEGLAEQLVIPALAEQLGCSLTDQLIATVAVGGSTFKHFLPLFGFGPDKSTHQYALKSRRVACVVDGDPAYQEPPPAPGYWKSCFPYELDLNPKCKYRSVSPVAERLKKESEGLSNIAVFISAKTFEYDLACATTDPIIITTECAQAEELRKYVEGSLSFSIKLDSLVPLEVGGALKRRETQNELPVNARFATYYLQAVSKDKGAHAFELAQALRERASQKSVSTNSLKVPDYIRQAVEWVCWKTDAKKHESSSSGATQAA